MLGSFFAYSFLKEVGLPFWLSIILGLAGVVVISVAMYLLVLKPIMRQSLVNMILATVGFSLLFESIALIKWGGYATGRSRPSPATRCSRWAGWRSHLRACGSSASCW